jgi:hypothetical protein
LRREEPPFDFKIHLFLDKPSEGQKELPSQRELTLKMMEKLQSLGARNVHDSLIKDRRSADDTKRRGNDKIKYTFSIDTADEALKCYNYFMNRYTKNNEYKKLHMEPKEDPEDDLGITATIMIYL